MNHLHNLPPKQMRTINYHGLSLEYIFNKLLLKNINISFTFLNLVNKNGALSLE